MLHVFCFSRRSSGSSYAPFLLRILFGVFCWQLGSTASPRPAGGERVVLKINEQILRAHESSPLFLPVKYLNISYLPFK